MIKKNINVLAAVALIATGAIVAGAVPTAIMISTKSTAR